MTNVNLRTGTAAPEKPADNSNQTDINVSLPRLMTQRDLAEYLGKSTAWCERARWAGEGPKFVKLGRNVRYRADDVLDWVNANIHQSTAEEAEV